MAGVQENSASPVTLVLRRMLNPVRAGKVFSLIAKHGRVF